VEEFDPELIKELRDRARDVMLTRAIVSEEKLVDTKPAEDLLSMEGMDEALAYELARHGIVTMEDLADQSVDELMVIDEMDEERAGKLIMTARLPWFESKDQNMVSVKDA
ncbi:MAG: helix-hairpin-helix domain-containing protein, partial [Gammaproteobacteria bacterium]